MEKVIAIIQNEYVFTILAALVIMGITQLIKLIPCFKDNNWNISFPVLFGYIAAFGWALWTKEVPLDQIDKLMAYGTGIATLSATLYGIFKKLFNKNYKMDKEIKDSELYSYLQNLFVMDIKDFGNKTTSEKYSYIVGIASDFKNIPELLKEGKKEEAAQEVAKVLSKFLTSGDINKSVDNLLEILKKEYKLPETINKNVETLVKPQ